MLALNPNDASPIATAGAPPGGKDDYDRVNSDYDSPIRLHPKLAGAYNNRSCTYYCKGDYDWETRTSVDDDGWPVPDREAMTRPLVTRLQGFEK